MSAKLIDGKKLAAEIRKDCAARVRTLGQHDVTPGLAVILVGDDAASAVYVGKKIKACENVGIRSFTDRYPADITNEALLSRIEELNADENVHGILVQLPLPAHIDMAKVLETIAVDKDVDGFHLYNVGGLVTGVQRKTTKQGSLWAIVTLEDMALVHPPVANCARYDSLRDTRAAA